MNRQDKFRSFGSIHGNVVQLGILLKTSVIEVESRSHLMFIVNVSVWELILSHQTVKYIGRVVDHINHELGGMNSLGTLAGDITALEFLSHSQERLLEFRRRRNLRRFIWILSPGAKEVLLGRRRSGDSSLLANSQKALVLLSRQIEPSSLF